MKKKYWVITIAAIITILILWYVFKKGPVINKPILQRGFKNATGGNSTVTTTTAPIQGFPIRYMEYNDNAKKLQALLGVTPDGYIGPDTIKAWKQYDPSVDSTYQIETPQELGNLISYITAKKNSGTSPDGSNTSAFNFNDGAKVVGGVLDFLDNNNGSDNANTGINPYDPYVDPSNGEA